MAVPVLQKTYNFQVNQLFLADDTLLNSADATNRRLMLALKQSLVETGSSPVVASPWTVVASSDGTTADLTDRWSDADTDLVWGTGNRSWILLRQTAIGGGNFEYLIDLNSTTFQGSRCTMAVSDTAFNTAGIAANTPPTAPSEARVVRNQVAWNGRDSNTASQFRLHVLRSTDGEVTRVFISLDQKTVAWYDFSQPQDPVSGWNNPYTSILYSSSNSTEVMTSLLFNDAASVEFRTEQPGGGAHIDLDAYISGRGAIISLITEQTTGVNRISGELPLVPCNLFSDQVGARGRHCRFYDLWWGLTNRPPGATYPPGSRDFVQLGDFIIPWDGSIPQLS